MAALSFWKLEDDGRCYSETTTGKRQRENYLSPLLSNQGARGAKTRIDVFNVILPKKRGAMIMAGQATPMVAFADEYGMLSNVLSQLDRRGITG